MYWPRKLPSGAAMVVARALPPFSRPKRARTWLSGTRRMTVAADIDQKPPMTTPTSARPAMKTAALGANATMSPDTIISAGQAEQHVLAAVDSARSRRDDEAGQEGEEAGDGDGLTGLTFGHVQVGSDRRQQADRHELRGDQRRDAEGKREDRAPGARALGRLVGAIGEGERHEDLRLRRQPPAG